MSKADTCYFCRENECLEQHHIVPRRYDGSDKDENLVTLCPNCHRKIESLYDNRFYEELGFIEVDTLFRRKQCSSDDCDKEARSVLRTSDSEEERIFCDEHLKYLYISDSQHYSSDPRCWKCRSESDVDSFEKCERLVKPAFSDDSRLSVPLCPRHSRCGYTPCDKVANVYTELNYYDNSRSENDVILGCCSRHAAAAAVRVENRLLSRPSWEADDISVGAAASVSSVDVWRSAMRGGEVPKGFVREEFLDDDGVPVNECSVEGNQLVIEECVICGETHRHGAVESDVEELRSGGYVDRVAHCGKCSRRGPEHNSYRIGISES